MADGRITRVGWIAIGLAVLAGLLALFNEATGYRESGVVDWGHVSLAFGAPVLMYVMIKSAAKREL